MSQAIALYNVTLAAELRPGSVTPFVIVAGDRAPATGSGGLDLETEGKRIGGALYNGLPGLTVETIAKDLLTRFFANGGDKWGKGELRREFLALLGGAQ